MKSSGIDSHSLARLCRQSVSPSACAAISAAASWQFMVCLRTMARRSPAATASGAADGRPESAAAAPRAIPGHRQRPQGEGHPLHAHPGWRQGDRAPDAVCERHGVLWPHPPGAPPDDAAHRASRGEVADVPVTGGRIAAAAQSVAVGPRATLPRSRVSCRRGGTQGGELHADRTSRADILPGNVAKIRVVPDKAGTFTFLCDIFCGAGHETMNGTITVIA